MPNINFLDATARNNVNASSRVVVFKAAAAVTRGYWVEVTDPNAAIPTVSHASASAVVAGTSQCIGVALNAALAAGDDVAVVVSGWCGYAWNDGTDLSTVGAALGISATAGKCYASTFSATAGNANVPPTSVVGYVAAATTAEYGPVVVIGKGF